MHCGATGRRQIVTTYAGTLLGTPVSMCRNVKVQLFSEGWDIQVRSYLVIVIELTRFRVWSSGRKCIVVLQVLVNHSV